MSSGSDVSEEILEEIQDENEPSSFSVFSPRSEDLKAEADKVLSWESTSQKRNVSSPVLLISDKKKVESSLGETSHPLHNEVASEQLPVRACHNDSAELSSFGSSDGKVKRKEEENDVEKQVGRTKRVSFPPRYLALGELQNKVENRHSDDSPMSSEWSVESLKSSGSSSFHIKDRSLSEVSVSIPKFTVVSIEKEHKVDSLVKQFSEHTDDGAQFYDKQGSKRRQSVPLYTPTPTRTEAFMSLQPSKEDLCESESGWQTSRRKSSVSTMVSYFSSQPSEDTSAPENRNRESPQKPGQMSPRIKNSLEKLASHFSQSSSQDIMKDTQERGILKSKENITPHTLKRRHPSLQQPREKENSPMQTSLEMEEIHSLEENIEELLNIAFPVSKTTSCESENVSGHKSIEEVLPHQDTFHRNKVALSQGDIFHSKVLDTEDTDDEIEDLFEDGLQSHDVPRTKFLHDSKVSDAKITSARFSFPSWDVHMTASSQDGSAKMTTNSSLGNIPQNTLSGTDKKGTEKTSKLFISPKNSVSRLMASGETVSSSSDVFQGDLEKSSDGEARKSEGRENLDFGRNGSGKECSSSVNSDAEASHTENAESESTRNYSLGKETSHELLELDIDGSDHDAFDGEFSEASEVILGFLSNSPISAITERTEESGQDNNPNVTRRVSDSEDSSNLQESAREFDSECQNTAQIEMTSASAILSPGNRGNFPSLPLMDSTINSSQFANSHSLQESVSPVQTHSSEVGNDSSQNPPSGVGHKPASVGVKPKLGKFPHVPRGQKSVEKHCTVPLSPTSKSSSSGPMKATLCRNTSKSMHNLGTSASSRPGKGQGLHNRSWSLSTDNLENNSPRSSSLSPAPQSLYKSRRNSGSSLHRRCISAIALNEGESQLGMKRNKSLSLNRLNRSRSSSMNSIASCKKADYSHVQSKVKQYIKDVKERDLRNSTRSLPSTPLRQPMPKSEEDVILINERMLNEFSDLNAEDLPEDIIKLRSKVLGEGGDLKVLEHILRLILEERKSRHASDTTLAALQLRYDNLNARYAEKQNEIDRLRFYKDIHINKDYTVTLRSQEEGRHNTASNWTSRNTTPVNTPYRSLSYYDTSPNTPQRRSSCHMTPPNTPNARSLSPGMTPIVKSTSTPLVDPMWSFVLEPSGSYTNQDSLPVDQLSSGDQEKSKDAVRSSGQDAFNFQTWMKETNCVLQKVKDFTVLQGHGAVEQRERNIIWQHILHEYWRLASIFPVLTLVSPTQEPGLLLQKLGKALQVTANRFDLELHVGKHQESDDGNIMQCSDSKEIVNQMKRDEQQRDVGVSVGNTEKSPACNQEKGTYRKSSPLHSKPSSEKTVSVTGDMQTSKRSPEHSPVQGGKNAPAFMKTVHDEVTLKISRREVPTSQIRQNESKQTNLQNSAAVTKVQKLTEGEGIAKLPAEREVRVDDDIHAKEMDLPANQENEDEAPHLCSPAHSRESMKTVGPLEKVKLWQDSLIGSLPAPGEYQSPPNMSGPPSILSVESSQSFDAEDLNDHLSDLQLGTDNPGSNGSINNVEDVGGFIEPVGLHIVGKAQGSDIGNSLPLNSSDVPAIDGDLPKSPWRSNSVTPRLPWNQSVKARDLDSGCPGSERSTRVSHNASFEHPEQGSNYHPSLEVAGDIEESEERERSLTYEVVNNNCIRDFDDRGMALESISQEKIKHPYTDRPTKTSAEGFTCEEKYKLKDGNQCNVSVESRVRSGCSRSSRNSSKNKRESQHSRSGMHDAPNWHSGETWDKGSPHKVLGKMYSLHEKGVAESTEEDSSEYSRSRKKNSKVSSKSRKTSRSRRSLERSYPSGAKCSCGGQSDTQCDTPHSQIQEVSDKLNESLGKIDAINQNLRKYRSKYVSGYASNISDDTSSSHSSHLDIYSNISRLKRDFKILQSQMLNLKSEVFHEKKRMDSSKTKNTKRGRVEPMRALDISKCMDSSLDMPQPDHTKLTDWNRSGPSKESRIRHQAPTPSKYFDLPSKHSYCFSDSQSVSGFDESKMECLAKSTPKDSMKKSEKKESAKKSNRGIRVEKHESFEGGNAKRQLNLSEIEVIDIQSPRSHPTSTQTFSVGFCTPRHIGVQTEERQIPVITCTQHQLDLNPSEDFQTCQMHLSRSKSEASGLVSPRHHLNASAPFVYIRNYHYGSDLSRAVSEDDIRTKKQKSSKRKHRRTGSSQQLIDSLDEVTSIAERVRLRSESMLSCLDLHVSVHENISKL